jgi:spore coat protein CotH
MNYRKAGLFLAMILLVTGCYRVVYLEETDPETAFAGNNVFDDSFIHSVELFLSREDWQAIIDEAAAYENTNPKRPYYQALLIFDGTLLNAPVGIRLKGHISIALSREHSFPLKLDFNRFTEKQTLDGLKKLNLNNNFDGPPLSIARDFISYHAWREFGVAASRTAFTEVFVNQEYLGIYALVEQVDGGFIKRHFPSPYGDLYKPEQFSGTLEYRGADISRYPDIGHKWPDKSDHSSLLHALEVLQSDQADKLGEVFDLESILIYLAGNVALGVFDYYPITGHNYYLYEASPGRFSMLPWDMNGSLEPGNPSICSPLEGYLSRKLMEDPGLQARYLELLSDFLNTAGSAERLKGRLQQARNLIGPEFPPEEFEILEQDIDTRAQWLRAELEGIPGCR